MAGRGLGAELIALAKAPLDFAAGSDDTLILPEELRTLSPDATLFEGAGHNVHVAKPIEVWAWAKQRFNRKVGPPGAGSYVEA